jgi:RNA polymerase sigma-70 factor (ECF subfamily)
MARFASIGFSGKHTPGFSSHTGSLFQGNLSRADFIRELFELHYERVYCFLAKRMSSDRAEDFAQDVFIRLLKHGNLERVEVTASYLFKIADNLVKSSYIRDARRRELASNLRETVRVRSLDDSSQNVPGLIESGKIHEAMAILTRNERSAITLVVCQGLSYEAAAVALGVNTTTLNNWKHRGVKKLREFGSSTYEKRRPERIPSSTPVSNASLSALRCSKEQGSSSGKVGVQAEEHERGPFPFGRVG